jgi:hypothetical protein
MPAPSCRTKKRRKPRKPNPTFPLTPHNNGQWCKNIRGKFFFLGVWEDSQKALDNYLKVAADLHAGRQPRPGSINRDGVKVKDVANYFLTEQMKRVDNHEITPEWFSDYLATIQHFCRHVGTTRLIDDLRPDDFQQYRNLLLRRGQSGKN